MVTRAVSTVPLSGHSNLLPKRGKKKKKSKVMSGNIIELRWGQGKAKVEGFGTLPGIMSETSFQRDCFFPFIS